MKMKFRAILIACFALAASAYGQDMRQTQTFQTSAGPVKITPIYHASTLIEAGGKVIYVDPAGKLKFPTRAYGPVDYTGYKQADLIILSDIQVDQSDPPATAATTKP